VGAEVVWTPDGKGTTAYAGGAAGK
jgi:hypothetical protein